MIPTNIQLTLRIPKGSPLTAEEVDANFTRLRDAITSLAEEFSLSRVVIGDEPPAGEREGVLWIPSDFRGIYVYNSATSQWVLLTPKEVINVIDTGTGANFIVQVPDGISTYSDLEGRLIVMKSGHNSTGTSKLKVRNSAGVLFDNDGVNLLNHYLGSIEENDIKAGQKVLLVYNTGSFQLLSPTPPIRIGDLRNVYTYQSNLAAIPSLSGGVLTYTHGLKHAGNDIHPAIVRVVLRRKTSDFTHVSGIVVKAGEEIDASALWVAGRGSENEMFWPVVRVFSSTTTIRVQFYYPGGIAMTWNHLGKNGNTESWSRGRIEIDGVAGYQNWEVRVYAAAYNPDQLGSASGGTQSGGANSPVITAQPSNQTVPAGSNATFSVTANYGTSVDWFFNGSQVSGNRFSDNDVVSGNTITSTLTISGVTSSDTTPTPGQIYARVNGTGGSADSSVATLSLA
jgi:hypothetical protein